jgi:ferritin heavy chain
MEYLNKRGGKLLLQNIPKPEQDEWSGPVEALEAALKIEKNVNQAFLDMHKIASLQNDPHFSNFIESQFLDEQVDSIREIASKITELKRVGPRLGEEFIDQTLVQKPVVENEKN